MTTTVMHTAISRLGRLSLILLSGGILGAGYWPGRWGIFAWVAFVPLLWIVQDASPARALLWGMAFGSAVFGAGTPWLYDIVKRWLDFPAPTRALCFAMFCAYHGLMVGLACATARWLAQFWNDRRGVDMTVATAVVMVPAVVAAEGYFPMQFPVRLANTQFFHLPFIQLAEVTGTAGLAWLIIGANAAIYLCLRTCKGSAAQSRRYVGLLACVVAVLTLNDVWGRWRMSRIDAEANLRIAQGRSLRIGMVQGRLPYDRDYLFSTHQPDLSSHNLSSFNRLSRLAQESAPLDLLIWPGDILPDILEYESADEFEPILRGEPLASFLRKRVSCRVPTMFYTVGKRPDQAQRWIVVLTGASQEPLGLAEKMILTPFGDYTPGARMIPALRRLNSSTRGMPRGERQKVLELSNKARIAVLICYEDLIASYAQRFIRMGSDIFVDVAGNSWADTTMQPHQHMRLAAMRAVENRRYLLRSATSGISAVIDPAGRIVQSLGARQEGAIAATIALMDGRPLSSVIGRGFYHLAAGLLAALYLGCLLWPRRARSSPSPL